jgi:hypothetical protein
LEVNYKRNDKNIAVYTGVKIEGGGIGRRGREVKEGEEKKKK